MAPDCSLVVARAAGGVAVARPPGSGAPSCAPGAARSPASAPVAGVVVPAVRAGAEGGLGRRTKTLPNHPNGSCGAGVTAGTTRPQEMMAGSSRSIEPNGGTEPCPLG